MNDGGGFQPATEQIHQKAKAEAEQESLKKLGSRPGSRLSLKLRLSKGLGSRDLRLTAALAVTYFRLTIVTPSPPSARSPGRKDET